MNFFKTQKLAILTIVYWFLLMYMVAALTWWFIALQNENHEITLIRQSELKKDDPDYFSGLQKIENVRKRKTARNIGEGTIFLALILVGAVYVFRATKRELNLSKQQQNFMMAVTHELKTPIAVAQLNLETLQKRKLDETTQQKLISNTLQEANRLNTLCNNILLASQMEADAYTTEKTEINFTDLIEGCIDDYKNRFPQRIIKEEMDSRIYLIGEAWLLQVLVNNLLENALKYSPKEADIQISLLEENGFIQLTVTDEGQTIAKEERNKIFEKFYRMGNENTRKAKGTGLGLYLCKKIVEYQKGTISVNENFPKGSRFTVLFKSV